LQVTRCLHTVWEHAGRPDTRPIRQRWPAVGAGRDPRHSGRQRA
jgi:hypothetical protein